MFPEVVRSLIETEVDGLHVGREQIDHVHTALRRVRLVGVEDRNPRYKWQTANPGTSLNEMGHRDILAKFFRHRSEESHGGLVTSSSRL
jgi:hypothetical protein